MLTQIVGMARHAVLGDVGRRAKRAAIVGHALGDHRAVRRHAEPDREIDVVLQQV